MWTSVFVPYFWCFSIKCIEPDTDLLERRYSSIVNKIEFEFVSSPHY